MNNLTSTMAAAQTSAVRPKTEILTQRIPLSTGIDLHYAVKTPEGPTTAQEGEKNRAIILVHGYSDSWRSYEDMLRFLPLRGHTAPVYALDLRGHGQSSGAPDNVCTQSSFADDIAAFMDALGIEKAVVIGHSMGGLIAHLFAVRHPSRVEALVLIAAAATMAGHPAVSELQSIVNSFEKGAPAPADFVLEFQASTFHGTVSPGILYRYVAESLRVRGIVWQNALDGMNTEDHRGALPGITAPVLVLWGDRDSMFTRAEQDELVTLLPNARLVVHAGAGHALNAERPADVVADLRDFLSEIA